MPNKSAGLDAIYLDSCVFVSWITGDDQERLDAIEAVFNEARNGKYRLITSTLTITEVAFSASEKDAAKLDAAVLQIIDAFWTPGPVALVELDRGIASDARNLIRTALEQQRRRPKPADAIHLVTARRMSVNKLFTYNLQDFGPWAADLGFSITNPQPIEQPLLPSGMMQPAAQSPTAALP